MMAHQSEVGGWESRILVGRQGNLEGNVGERLQKIRVVGSQACRIVQAGDCTDSFGSRRRCRVGTGIVLERMVSHESFHWIRTILDAYLCSPS